jgi:DNA-binding GntR family transcriptional regulator
MPVVKPFADGVPLYRQVQTGIEAMLRAHPRAKEVPLSDAQLAERFGVSRITVRRAVDELVDAGILYRIQGVGTFVRQNKLGEKLTLNSFLDAWTQKSGLFNVRVGVFERVAADANLAERLAVAPGTELAYVRRLRFQKETLVAVDERYLRADYSARLTTQDIKTSSLVDYLRNREGIEVDHGEMEIEARAADHREAKELGIRRGQPILVRRVTFLTKKNEPVIAGRSIYRADRVSYRLTVST